MDKKLSPPIMTDDEIAKYKEDGVVCLRNCISREWLEMVGAASKILEASPGPMAEHITAESGPVTEYFTDLEMAQRLPSFERFARDGPCAALAGKCCSLAPCCVC